MNPQESQSPSGPLASPQEQAIPVTPSSPPLKIGKFKASKMLVQESFSILKQDKELMWFPVLSAIVSMIALAIFVAVFFFVVAGGSLEMLNNISERSLSITAYVIIFLYYLLMFFITNYFLAGIYTIINGRFNGQNLSFSDGIKNADAHINKIFMWSLISATVGIVLRIISDKSRLVGKIVTMVFGAGWTILTYFSLPSLIIGKRSIKESFDESATAIRKTWGETIIINFGIGLFLGLITFFVIAMIIGVMILVPTLEMVLLLGMLFIIYIIAISVVSSTLGSIIKLALYIYATTGTVPQGFTPELIKGSVRAGK
jgi:hypothetical protein